MFVASEASVTLHGAYAIQREPQVILRPQGTGVGCLVGQFPWGPDSADLTKPHEPTGVADMLKTFGPVGMDRTMEGYMAMISASWPTLKVCRILGSTAAKATVALQDSVPATILTLTALYKGTEGNKIDAIVSAASDGDSNHFDLEVTVSDGSGTTSEKWRNLNYSGVGTARLMDISSSRLVGLATAGTAGRPDNGSEDFSGGLDGTIASAAYLGTPGSGDSGVALAENDKTIRTIFTDDCGNTIRAAVQAGLVTHAILMGDRRAFVHGNSGMTLSAAQSDKANYASEWAIYCDCWAKVRDHIDGTLRLVPPSVFGASLRCQLSPSTSIAWKNSVVGDMLSRIAELETPRGNGAGSNSQLGICTLVAEENGGYRFEAGVTTVAQSEPTKRLETRLAIGIYIAGAFTKSIRGQVDAPNVELNQASLVTALDQFMKTLVANVKKDPNNLPHVVAYSIPNIASYNSTQTIAGGDFYVPLDVQTSSQMERIFLSFKFGEGVTVTAS